jgi:hypothetical protein
MLGAFEKKIAGTSQPIFATLADRIEVKEMGRF